jgi:putative nucleotidyltransferase with HDIG domain
MLHQEKNIVVVDDERYVCDIITEALGEFEEFNISRFTDPLEAIGYISENSIDLVLTDLVMGEHSGVGVLEAALENHPDAVVLLMTGYPTVKTAISVLKKGGYDYLIKPFKLEDLKATILRGLEHQRVKRENVTLRSQLELMKVSEAMALGMKLHHLLNMIVNSTVSETPARAASIILLDRKAGVYRVRCLSETVEDNEINDFLKGQGRFGALRHPADRPHIFNDRVTVGAKSFKRSFVIYPLISKGANIGFLSLVSLNRFDYITPGQEHLISLLASTAASAVDNDYMSKNLRKSYMMTIKALANAVEARDKCTAGHTDRVYRVARLTARRLGWQPDRIGYLRTGCILHDIGKIAVPDAILNKPGKLTSRERAIMERHPELGARILRGIPFLEPVIPYIISHHERYDGTGYPYKLAGEDIPIEGRLLAVADTFDAIMSDRPYRASASSEKAIEELQRFRGTQFDPIIVDAFMAGYREGSANLDLYYSGSSTGEKAIRSS